MDRSGSDPQRSMESAARDIEVEAPPAAAAQPPPPPPRPPGIITGGVQSGQYGASWTSTSLERSWQWLLPDRPEPGSDQSEWLGFAKLHDSGSGSGESPFFTLPASHSHICG
eukprot:scaffold657749_cov45-Prasinocladus_malaysianus.AAC.1